MRLVRHLNDLPYDQLADGSVVTIGSYDGLHLGHVQLLDRVKNASGKLGLPSAVMSFEPTPKEFFAADSPPARLMRFREKFEALQSNDIDIPKLRCANATYFGRRFYPASAHTRALCEAHCHR
jgi:riboflavin kinase/FMN adenylyltransferase